ncbi:MAG TPA: hypothetical protein VF837_05645 [Patescibacteria group bacterium]
MKGLKITLGILTFLMLLACAGLAYLTWFPQTTTGQENLLGGMPGSSFTITVPVNIKGQSQEEFVLTNAVSRESAKSKYFIPGSYTIDQTIDPGTWTVYGGRHTTLLLSADQSFEVVSTSSPSEKNLNLFMLIVIVIFIPITQFLLWQIQKHK